MAVVQVVGGLLRLSFGRPEPAGCAEGIPGLVPRGVAQLQRVVDDRESVPCLVLAQSAQAGTDAREHSRADEVPRGEVDALDTSVVIEQAVDAPALLPRVGVLVGLLVEARERRRYPGGVGLETTRRGRGRVCGSSRVRVRDRWSCSLVCAQLDP